MKAGGDGNRRRERCKHGPGSKAVVHALRSFRSLGTSVIWIGRPSSRPKNPSGSVGIPPAAPSGARLQRRNSRKTQYRSWDAGGQEKVSICTPALQAPVR
jgi:hypothetical protein